VVFIVSVAAVGSLVPGPSLNLLLTGFFTAVVTLSLVPLTGYAGQISLAQLTFTGIGAVAMGAWGANGEPWAVLLSVGLCAVVGALVAFPALRPMSWLSHRVVNSRSPGRRPMAMVLL
jgi:ABC-type branched-subunit amino acid transport system permease subunit